MFDVSFPIVRHRFAFEGATASVQRVTVSSCAGANAMASLTTAAISMAGEGAASRRRPLPGRGAGHGIAMFAPEESAPQTRPEAK